jgi:acetyl esterase/lipase
MKTGLASVKSNQSSTFSLRNTARLRALIDWRLAIGALSFAVAQLAVWPAPTTTLWMLAIGVTEWGHVLAVFALLPLFPGWMRSPAGRIGALLGVLAAVLALSPLGRAVVLARHLPAELESAFVLSVRSTEVAAPRQAPLSARDLVRGVASPVIPPDRLIYITRDNQPLTLNFYRPPHSHAPAPCVLVIHGGSWRTGDSTELAPLNSYLAARGYAVASINYRLGATHPFPAARDDVSSAVAYLKAKSSTLGIDATRLILLGRSAGGQLALLVAYTAHDPAIRGVVSFYGPSDLPYAYEHPANPLVLDTRGVLSDYLGGDPKTVPAQYDAASAINFVGEDTPPTLLVHGARDELVSPAQSERLAAKLAGANRPHFLLLLPWATHGCDYNFSGPCGQISTYTLERFLGAVTDSEQSAP